MKQILKILKNFNFTKEEQEQNQMILDMVYELAMNEIIEKEQDWDEEGAHFDPQTKQVSYPTGMMDLYKKCYNRLHFCRFGQWLHYLFIKFVHSQRYDFFLTAQHQQRY